MLGATQKSGYFGSHPNEETQKIISILRSPMPAQLVPGVGVSELHRIVTGHQTQLDTLVDRIANVLSSMHAELQQDVRSSCRDALSESGMGALDFKLKKLESEMKTGLDDCRDARELRSWLEGRVDTLSGQIATDLEGMQLHLSQDACGLHERLAAVEAELQGADEAMPTKWRLGLDRACAELRQELRQEMRLSVLDNHFEARILALEQQQRQGSPLVSEIQGKLQGLEISMQRQGIAVENIVGDMHHLRQTSLAHEEFRIRQSEARESSNDEFLRRAALSGFDQSAIASMRSRIETIEQRCDTTQEKLESTSTAFQQLRCSVANSSEKGDQGVKAIQERLDALASSSSQLQHHIPVHVQRVLSDLLITQRIDEMSEQVDSLAAVVLRQDSRSVHGSHENKRFRELEAGQEELASSLAELQGMVEQFVSQLLEAGAVDKYTEQPLSVKPPRPQHTNVASPQKSSESKHKRRDSGNKYAEELPKKLELIAGSLEVVDDLVQRIRVLEERGTSDSAARSLEFTRSDSAPRSLEFTPGSSEEVGQSKGIDIISADVHQLSLRISLVEQNVKDSMSGEAKTDRYSGDIHDIKERVHDLENMLAKGDKSLELTQSFSMFDRDRLTIPSGGDLHLLEERISELEKDRASCSIGVPRSDKEVRESSAPSKEDFSKLQTKVNDMELKLANQSKDGLQAPSIISRVEALDAKVMNMIPPRDNKASDDQIRGIVPRIELLVPRIEAVEKDLQLLRSEDIQQLKQDVEHIHETSGEWRRQFAATTENAVSSLQKQLMTALTGMASPSVVSSARSPVMSSARSRRRTRSGSSSGDQDDPDPLHRLNCPANNRIGSSRSRESHRVDVQARSLSRSRSVSRSASRSPSRQGDHSSSLRTWVKTKRDKEARSRSPSRSPSRSSGGNEERGPRSPSRSRSRSRSPSRSRSASRSRSTSRSRSSFREETRLSLRSWGRDCSQERNESGLSMQSRLGQEQNRNASSASDALGRLKAAEDTVQELLRKLPPSLDPSARRNSAAEAEDMLSRAHEKAVRLLAPVLNEGATSAETPTEADAKEMKERVEDLLRGKVVTRVLLRRVRRLQPLAAAKGENDLITRLADAVHSLETLKVDLRECFEEAMIQLRMWVDEVVPPSSEGSLGDDIASSH